MRRRHNSRASSGRLWRQALTLGWEAQNVIALRLWRLGRGGARARSEAHRMVSEKIHALAEAQGAVVAAAFTGKGRHLPGRLLQIYGKRVRKNRRRLTR